MDCRKQRFYVDMKTLLALLPILIGIVALLCVPYLIVRDEEPEHFKYKGHKYISFEKGVVHDPICCDF